MIIIRVIIYIFLFNNLIIRKRPIKNLIKKVIIIIIIIIIIWFHLIV